MVHCTRTIHIFIALLALLNGGLLLAAEPDPYPPVSRDSAFMKRLLQQPITANRQDTRVAALICYRTGNLKDGEALDQFEKRRLLAKFLGEPFEFTGSREQAIEAERTAVPLKTVVQRALESVVIDYAAPDTELPQPSPEARPLGHGMWATDAAGTAIQIPMLVRHTLDVPATTVSFRIGESDWRKPHPYYLFLTCKPVGASVFSPGKSQPALCAGSGRPEEMKLAIEALLERVNPAPLPAYSFMTPEADLMGDFIRSNDDDAALVNAATRTLAATRCEDFGNCEVVAKRRAAAEWQVARPRVFVALAIAIFVLAGFLASRTSPRAIKGWFVSTLAVLIVAVSALAIAATVRLLAPNIGLEGYIYAGFLIFGLVPHLAAVAVVALSLTGGGATRLRVFAVVVGLLIPALIWICLAIFGGG